MEKSVKEVSELTGISVRTLQYYDDQGILVPKRNELNHRVYTMDDLQKLWEIYFLKNAGLSLNEIKQFFDDFEDKKVIMNKKHQLYIEIYNLVKEMALLDIFFIEGIGNCPLHNFKLEMINRLKHKTEGELHEKNHFSNHASF